MIDLTLIFYERKKSSTKLRTVLTMVGTKIATILLLTTSGSMKVNGKRMISY